MNVPEGEERQMNMDYSKKLEKAGFIVVSRNEEKQLPEGLLKRHPGIPPDYLQFLRQFTQITNAENTAWFLSVEDFRGESETAFLWNEFESQSEEAFQGDAAELESVREFWDKHLPVAMSVKGEYQYLALCLGSENYGAVVYGAEPEYEDAQKVCDSFAELINLFETAKDNAFISIKQRS